ncbi:MAG: hypothetical protein IH621_02600 [Krumholzibacteria bacterium]|nr:hypothetical protein [Candidatus Krumholzibacteria bacterium]
MSRVRLLLVLGGVLAALAVAFWLLRADRDTDLTAGGPLLATDLGTVERIQLTLSGVPTVFERREDSLWTMSGAVHDWVDPLRLSQQLAVLGAAEGGRLLPGTEPEDRRYEFNGPQAVRLVLFGPGGSEERLSLGAANPVTGNVYASGAGRTACFPVLAETRDRLARLPEAVRLTTVLPPVPLTALERITVTRGRRTEVLAAAGGRWWLLVPAADLSVLPPLAQDWQRLHDDRRRRDDEGLWVLADERRVGLLAYEAGQLQVSSFVPPEQAADALDQWELDPAWLTVVLEGRGIDPDPTTGTPDRLVVGFGPPLDEKTVPAVRRGNPLLVPRQALATLEAPPGDLLHLFAFTDRPLLADEVELAAAGGPLLRARRVEREVRHDERAQWDQLLPEPGRDEARAHLTARNFIVDLDRLAVLAVLPPTDAKRVLQPEGRVTVTVRWGDPARSEVWHCGRLDLPNVPGGPERLVPGDDGEGPVGFWRPADGRLLQVPSTVLVTARNLAR